MTDGTHTGRFPASESSIAGARSDQKLAAIMTPAAKPSIESRSLRGTFLVPNTIAAPHAVIPLVNNVTRNACKIGDSPEKTPINLDNPSTCFLADTVHLNLEL